MISDMNNFHHASVAIAIWTVGGSCRSHSKVKLNSMFQTISEKIMIDGVRFENCQTYIAFIHITHNRNNRNNYLSFNSNLNITVTYSIFNDEVYSIVDTLCIFRLLWKVLGNYYFCNTRSNVQMFYQKPPSMLKIETFFYCKMWRQIKN